MEKEEKATDLELDSTLEDAQDEGQKTIYEIGFLLTSTISEEDLTKEILKIRDIIEKFENRFISEGSPIKKDLEYTITLSRDGSKSDFDQAYFSWLKYELNPNDIKSIDESLKKLETVVRFLILKTTEDNFVPFVFVPKTIEKIEITSKDDSTKTENKEPISISKEELDKTIEELVID